MGEGGHRGQGQALGVWGHSRNIVKAPAVSATMAEWTAVGGKHRDWKAIEPNSERANQVADYQDSDSGQASDVDVAWIVPHIPHSAYWGSPAHMLSTSFLVPYVVVMGNLDTCLYKYLSTSNGLTPFDFQ